MTPRAAQEAIDRRAAAAVLAGATLGDLPLLWLIREALEDYVGVALRWDAERKAMRAAKAADPTALLSTGGLTGHRFVLTADNESRVVLEFDSFGSCVRAHEVPNAALVLHDAVRDDPVAAARLLVTIESATKEAR